MGSSPIISTLRGQRITLCERREDPPPGTDDELSAIALAADPNVAVDDDAVCVWDVTGDAPIGWLPEWYMPSPMGGARLLRGWRRRVVFLIIASFLVITAYGLCNTYGQLHFG